MWCARLRLRDCWRRTELAEAMSSNANTGTDKALAPLAADPQLMNPRPKSGHRLHGKVD
jgi:hypothetical protein